MSKVSEAIVEQVFDVLVETDQPLLASEVAARLGVHKTTAGDALRQLLRRDVAERMVGKSGHGHPPYLWSASGSQASLPVEQPVRRDTNKNRPATKKRVKRGSMTDLVRSNLSHWSPSGRGFTVYQMHKQVGQGSYESVRKSVNELIVTGEIIVTEKCRKHARVYLPAAAAPPAPITAPAAPAVPVNLSGIDALFNERDTLLKRHAQDEARLAEIDTALDALRARLA